jgi:5-methylcytosine-specific restriction endonuclease McrA
MIVSPKLWRQVFERDNGFCQYCGEDLLSNFNHYWSATVDHIQHRSEGGPDTLENLVLACTPCNGMLSKSQHRSSVETRREFVLNRREEEAIGFSEWIAELRPS